MLRSMLYVRYGSGCSRRVTVSAARPSAWKSVQSNRAQPSSKVRRRPSTALCKMLRTVEFKVHPTPGQAQLASQHVKVLQPRLLARAEVEAENVRQITPTEPSVEAQPRRLAMGDRAA